MADDSIPSRGSAKLSRHFYDNFGAAGLAARTTSERDRLTLRDLAELLPGGGRILDIGCGYGRAWC